MVDKCLKTNKPGLFYWEAQSSFKWSVTEHSRCVACLPAVSMVMVAYQDWAIFRVDKNICECV